MEDKELILKAKRRIKRFLQTGEKQSRVRDCEDGKKFVYIVKHRTEQKLYFRVDSLGRIYKSKTYKTKFIIGGG